MKKRAPIPRGLPCDLGQELAASNERLRGRLHEITLSWRGRFAACIHEAQQAGELAPSFDPDITGNPGA